MEQPRIVEVIDNCSDDDDPKYSEDSPKGANNLPKLKINNKRLGVTGPATRLTKFGVERKSDKNIVIGNTNESSDAKSIFLRSLELSYGKDVSTYVRKAATLTDDWRTGTIVTTRETFRKCQKFLEARCEKLAAVRKKEAENRRNQETAGRQIKKEFGEKKVATNPATETELEESFANYNKSIAMRNAKNLKILSQKPKVGTSVATKLMVDFKECCKAANRLKWMKISDCCKDTWNYRVMYENMMLTDIGVEKMIDYAGCSDDLIQILRDFNARHKKFRFFSELRTIPSARKSANLPESKLVSLYQYQKYFSRVFYAVIPLALFGNHRNVKKLRKALMQYYLTPIGEKVSLTNFLQDLKISSIKWLDSIADEDTRWSVLAKVTKWIFEKYLSAILSAVLTVQKSLYSDQKVFVRSELWRQYTLQYIKSEEAKGALKSYQLYSNTLGLAPVPSGRLSLIAKPTGLRPICAVQCDKYEKGEVILLQTLLHQIYLEKYERTGMKELHALWRSYATSNEDQEKRRLYLVSCDVEDAFASIDQNVLFDIINSMFDALPETLELQWYSILNRSPDKLKVKIDRKRWYNCGSRPFLGRHSTIVTPMEDELSMVEKKTPLVRIKAFIFNQTFQFATGQYVLKRGVIQGSRLSPVLADIYYAEMGLQQFNSFIESGKLLRFVDDFLHITRDKNEAKRFLATIRKDTPGYNCRFNMSKTQTNVKSAFCKRSTAINWLGYSVNGETLDVHPVYENSSLRCIKLLPYNRASNSIDTFKYRMHNTGVPKLDSILLDPTINTMSGILKNAELAAHRMALRCALYISAIFTDLNFFRKAIIEATQSAVQKLGLIFQHHFQTRGSRKRKNSVMPGIQYAIWKSIFRVFNKDIRLRKHFCEAIKRKMQALKAIMARTKV